MGVTSLHLVCLREPDPNVMETIQKTFDDGHYMLNDTQIVVVKPPNGGKSVYERIKEALGDDFTALVVRFQHFHGRHSSDLWPWLAEHVDSD